MIKRIYMQWSLRSKYLQKISAENPYKIGSWLSSPYDKGTEGASHRSPLIAHLSSLTSHRSLLLLKLVHPLAATESHEEDNATECQFNCHCQPDTI